MLRSALVALDGSEYSESATALAIDWAKRFDARLLGLGILDEPAIRGAEPVPLGASAFKATRDEHRLDDAHRRLLDFLDHFRTQTAAAGVSAEVLEEIGDPAERILSDAHRCDLVILARETHFHFETQSEPDETLSEVLRSSPRPVVTAPRTLREGSGVLIAYANTREAARALQIFHLLGLDAGERVEVMSVHRNRAEAKAALEFPGAYLAMRGASHELRAIESPAAPADIVLQEIERMRPRLLVMGAHGHHPVRDLFETSVLRAVLRLAPVPVFVGA
jgi:nucleotide-binding universal stress UspA family protein